MAKVATRARPQRMHPKPRQLKRSPKRKARPRSGFVTSTCQSNSNRKMMNRHQVLYQSRLLHRRGYRRDNRGQMSRNRLLAPSLSRPRGMTPSFSLLRTRMGSSSFSRTKPEIFTATSVPFHSDSQIKCSEFPSTSICG